LYDDFQDADPEYSRVLPTAFFGYRTITVERPLRLNFAATDDRVAQVFESKPIVKLDLAAQDKLRAALASLGGDVHRNRADFGTLLGKTLGDHEIRLKAPERKAVLAELSERDDAADVCTDAKGNAEPDAGLRDTENVPLSEAVADYFAREVKPHVPDAWIDESKTVVGYEIPFTRTFYKYEPPRPLGEIDADLNALAAEIMNMLREVEQ
jgi:type I restriction enzyme M protein